ncbi:DUF1353 domain-containing protein [Brevundimonas sp.]|uniref:DUF1353 domain-containing protein n=1 Tax=Brevundimonas sp. TaxID=1871086 RepID=UPI00286CAA0E|nr:DUF1353 domain-containing protein [Brevundimonas sp.]
MTPTPVRITDDVRISESWSGRELPGDIVDGRQRVKLTTPVDYRDRTQAGGESVILVPAGFVTDFASMPFGVRNLFPALGIYARPSIIHDLLYLIEGDLPNLLERLQAPRPGKSAAGTPMLTPEEITAYLNITSERPWVNTRRYLRHEADAVFAEAMQVVGVSAWRRTVMHRAVRMGGGNGWGR